MSTSRRGLQVKAVLLKDGVEEEGVKEIRRFRVDEEESGGVGVLQLLLIRVHAVFNVDLSVQKCTLFWKDDDDDLVQFSTEEELSHALEVMPDDTFRLYVTLSADETEETGEHVNEKRVTFDVVTADPAQYAHCTSRSAATRLACPGMAHGHARGHRDRMAWKAECKKGKKIEAAQNKEFHQVRQQVPEEFRRWVRQYVRLWSTQGPDAALAAATATGEKKLPEGVPHDFPQWLHTFLSRHHAHTAGPGEMEMEVVLLEEEPPQGDGEGPEGLPPVYFRWLCLFLPRFRSRFGQVRRAESDGDEGRGAQGEGQKKKGHRRQGKHGCHGGRNGGKHDGAQCAASSESEESDGGQKAWKKVPKEFRHYARVTVNQMHKKKGDNSDNKEQATRDGLSAEVQEFVEQILLEWHAKLTNRRPRAVALEMMAGERTLPVGVEEDHFLWLCRFLGRWHRRHAGKCDVMSGWSSGETTTDDTSGEEGTSAGQVLDYGPWPGHHSRELRAMMRMIRGRHPHGSMMGHHHPPPPPFFAGMHAAGPPGFFSCPLPARCCFGPPRFGAKRCGMMRGAWAAQQDGSGKRWKEQDGAAQGGEASRAQDDDAVGRVTESMKKM